VIWGAGSLGSVVRKKHIEWFGLRENPQDHPIFNGNITKYMEISMVNAFH